MSGEAKLTKRWIFSHCEACAVLDREGRTGVHGHDPGVGCPSDGPGAEDCEAVWIEAPPDTDMRVLRIGPPTKPPRVIKLRDLGFQYRVSDAALAEIAAAERRAARVISTAHLFTFGLAALSQNKDADHG